MFPLPRVWLFPYVALPLYVFEDRYRQMIEDSLDGPGRIVLATVQRDEEDRLAGSPRVYPVAGLGEIGRHDRRGDGCFDVLLVGLQRVRVREVPSDRLYRKVEVEPLEEVPVPAERHDVLRGRLVAAIRERTEGLTELPAAMPLSHLADLLLLRIPLEFEDMSELHAELDVERRARRALELHGRRPRKA